MSTNIRLAIIVICLLTALSGMVAAQDVADGGGKIPWKITVVMFDGVDPYQQAEIPLKEATSFVEDHSRLKLDIEYISEYRPHDVTPYATGEDYDGDGKGDEWAYLMMSWNLPDEVLNSLPESSTYLFLYRLNGYRPLQAGSALPLEYGLWSRGKQYVYGSVPTDQWWYVNEPYEGFQSRAAQILTHEIVNTIQGRLEAPPYRCQQLIVEDPKLAAAAKYEAARLAKITGPCYDKLSIGANN